MNRRSRPVSRIRIVLGEDHALMLEGTRRILAGYPDFDVVGEAQDGERLLELVESLLPDVALVDVRMPRLSGIEVVRRMKERQVGTRPLVLTAYDDDDYVVSLIEAGAAGYVLKSMTGDQLAGAIRRVNQGEIVLDPRIETKVLGIWKRGPGSSETERREELSAREKEVLALSATGLRNRDISQRLGISVRTVEGHFSSIIAKLEVSSRTCAILHALSHHLVERSPEAG